VKLDPTFKKLLRFGLIGIGALTVASAVVNLIAAWQLIEAAEEQSLGITRNEFMLTYGVVLAGGVALVVAGLGWRK
jgi:hypothetical protein